MIKLIREGAMARVWFFRSLMFAIAFAFIGGMGWWGFGESGADIRDAVIVAGDDTVTLNEYRRVYRNAYRQYRQVSQDVKEETVQQFVINSLIEDALWLQAAKAFGVTATAEELQTLVAATEAFQTNGSFDSRRYQQVLRSNYITPLEFEAEQMDEILRQKAKAVVRDSIVLTTKETEIARAIEIPETAKLDPEKIPTPEQLVLTALFRKQQRAVLSFQESLKAETDITIQHQLL
jgi:parvulin-like peptidyl-prolyl isomerase